MIAYTRAVPSSIVRCELTHLSRAPIDLDAARAEHAGYVDALGRCAVDVRSLPPCDELADSVFVEDTAVVLDEVAVITRPGAESRRAEAASTAAALNAHRTLATIQAPATLDGGDVLVLDRDVFVGLSSRSTLPGMQQLRAIVAPLGYTVHAVPVRGCLHLKSAVTRAGARTLVVNPAWVDPAHFPGWEIVPVDVREPCGANVVWLGDTTLVAEAFPRTNALLARSVEAQLLTVRVGELAKAEGALTCCSLLVTVDQA